MDLKKLNEQVMVITGASSGIGMTTARMAADAGARLVLAARSEDAIRDLANEIISKGGEAVAVVADVGKEEDVRRIAEAANERFGGFDTWVNNAGVSIYGKLADVEIEDQKRLFDTNYWGVVYGSLIAAEQLAQRGGALINVGSTVSDRALPLQGAYSASKHAVKAFTDALRMELEHDGAPVSVTLIKPGAINTPYTENAKNYMEVEPKFPPPVYAPETVADAILHCAQTPTRDVFVGGGGKALSFSEKYAPRLTDKFMQWFGFDAQKSNRRDLNPEENGLHEASGGGRAHGRYEGHVSNTSLYTKSMLHPVLTGGLLLAGVGLIYALTKNRNGHNKSVNPKDPEVWI